MKKQTTSGHGVCAWNATIFAVFAIWLAAIAAMSAVQHWWPASGWQSILLTAVSIGLLAAPLVYIVSVRPLIRRLEAEESLSRSSPTALTTVDPLTHILNQRGINASLLEAMAQAQRYHTPLALALIRLEDLNDIGKRHGGHGRTRALQFAASVIGEVVRLPDRVGRNANDEFVVIMPQTKTPAANKVAERICAAFAAQQFDPEGDRTLSVKYGVAAFGKGEDLEGFIANATRALRDNKTASRRRASP